MLDALASVAERLATRSWEQGGADALAALARAAGVTGAWLFEHRPHEAGTDAVAILTWSRGAAARGSGASHRFPDRWLELMRTGQMLIPGAGSSSWYADRALEGLGLGVSIVVPIVVDADAWGFLALGERHPSRAWSHEEAVALRAAASLIAGAIVRERGDRILDEADERYQALVEEIPAITYIDRPDPTSPTGYRPVFFSPQSGPMLGYTPCELEGRPELWIQLLHEEDREAALTADAAHHATGEPLAQEYRLVAKDGHIVWIRDQALMVRDDAGEPKFSHGVLLDISEQKLAEARLRDTLEALAKTDQQRRALLDRLVTAEEEERARIARNIHDESIQHLAFVSMSLEILRTRVEGPKLKDDVKRLTEAVRSAIGHLRDLLTELRPPLLDSDGLEAAVRAALDQLSAETRLRTSLRSGLDDEPPVEVAVIAYRIVQEALMNVRKHADASHVRVVLASDRQGISVTVVDNGVGFDTTVNGRPGHLGLAAMRERAELAGGWFEIESAPDGGTTVRVWVPVGGPGSPAPERDH
jgi:PAS domain S-box-containing protein